MRDISARVQFIGGTTELMITPPIAAPSSPASVKRFRVKTPYSSTVCNRAVVSRQFAINSSPRNTPNTVFVLPTSMVNSMRRRQKLSWKRKIDSSSYFILQAVLLRSEEHTSELQ